MFQTFLSYLVLYGLKSNLVACNGSGALIFQREKMYTSYRFISNLFLILGVILTASISFFLEYFIYSKYDLYNISFSVNVLIVGAYNMLVSLFIKKSPSFSNYVYENSFSYAYDMVFTLSVILSLDMTLSIPLFFMSLLSAVVCIFVTSALIGFFVKSVNRGYINDSFRNVAVRLFLLAIIAIIFYYTAQLDITI